MAEVEWYITVGEAEQGPFSNAQVRSFVDEGKLSPSMRMRRGDMAKSVRAGRVSGLFPDGATTTSIHARTSAPTASASSSERPAPAMPATASSDEQQAPPPPDKRATQPADQDAPHPTPARRQAKTAPDGSGATRPRITRRHARGRRGDGEDGNQPSSRKHGRKRSSSTKSMLMLFVGFGVFVVLAIIAMILLADRNRTDLTGTWLVDTSAVEANLDSVITSLDAQLPDMDAAELRSAITADISWLKAQRLTIGSSAVSIPTRDPAIGSVNRPISVTTIAPGSYEIELSLELPKPPAPPADNDTTKVEAESESREAAEEPAADGTTPVVSVTTPTPPPAANETVQTEVLSIKTTVQVSGDTATVNVPTLLQERLALGGWVQIQQLDLKRQ